MLPLIFALACALDPLATPPLPAPPASSPAPLPLAPGALSPLGMGASEGVALYALQIGETRLSFGQLYAGNEGWLGARGARQVDGDRLTAWAPVVVYVAVHPELGAILFDGGVRAEQTAPDYYAAAGGRAGRVWDGDAHRLAPDGALLAQLDAIGIAPGDVRRVVLSHLHEEHLGEVGAFEGAQVLVSELEWQDRGRASYAPSLASIPSPERFGYTSGPFGPFGESLDLLGDGSVILLPTPGHTLGHTSALVRLEEGWAVITGDAVPTIRHLDPASLAPFNYFGLEGLETQADAVERLVALQSELGDAAILPPHDPSDYTALLLDALRDGALSASERASLSSHQSALYDEGGALLGSAAPRGDDWGGGAP